uniref:Uncharacterized protein n=1 Tax=Nelumbo nucifera TaxID=4432 RepID=A0A822YU38_NELNU|nr:TPA_asm: hypothetical protein HUJ06_005255 [Nelumbo nucifera]
MSFPKQNKKQFNCTLCLILEAKLKWGYIRNFHAKSAAVTTPHASHKC